MRALGVCLPALAAAGFLAAKAETPVDWPQWRGPQGNGISEAVDLPTNWDLENTIVWKTPLPSWSGATPVIWGDRIFIA
jgi:hypothetical protein